MCTLSSAQTDGIRWSLLAPVSDLLFIDILDVVPSRITDHKSDTTYDTRTTLCIGILFPNVYNLNTEHMYSFLPLESAHRLHKACATNDNPAN